MKMKMEDNATPMRIMRRRGRPRKFSSDNSPIRKTRTLRLTEEEVRHITENARRCRKNFSEYCRQVLMGYMFLTTIVCISYTIYTAFNQCLWDEIWERIWLPLLVFCGHVWMRSLDCLAEHQGGQATQTLNVPVKGDFESQEPFRFTSESSRRL